MSSNASSIAQNEGFRSRRYLDTRGKQTVGYGFNIDDPAIGRFVPADVKTGKRQLSVAEAQDILENKILPVAVNDARTFAGPAFDQLDPVRKQVLVDLAYNMGGPRLGGFKKMQAALQSGDFTTAAQELLSSNYAKQVPERARRNAQLLLTGGM